MFAAASLFDQDAAAPRRRDHPAGSALAESSSGPAVVGCLGQDENAGYGRADPEPDIVNLAHELVGDDFGRRAPRRNAPPIEGDDLVGKHRRQIEVVHHRQDAAARGGVLRAIRTKFREGRSHLACKHFARFGPTARLEAEMDAVKLPEGVWVVVCDGRKALILENIGDADYPDLRTRNVDKQDDASTSDMGADRPGRVHQSVGTHRSAMEETDWHHQAEEAFLIDLIHRLDAALLSKKVKDLVIVAPPRALGALRKAYSDHVRGALVAEIDKDLTTMPVDQIERHLVGK